jgi:hypothetical protein
MGITGEIEMPADLPGIFEFNKHQIILREGINSIKL